MAPVYIEYVLFANKEIQDVEKKFTKACNGAIKILARQEEGDDKAGVLVANHKTSKRPVPNQKVLAHFGRGFDAQAAASLAKARAAIVLKGVGPFDTEHKLLRQLTTCVSRLSQELNAFVFDAADWLTFTPQAFHDLRSAEVEHGQLSCAQFGVRAYRIEGGIRSVSMGLEKFGQPNFAFALFSEHQMGLIDRMMTLAMQHIIESDRRMEPGPLALSIKSIRNQRLKEELVATQRPGASGRAKLQLDALAPHKGDPEVLLAPVFEAADGPQLWEEQGQLLQQLFGTDRHVSTNVDMGELIQQAIEKARNRAAQILSDPKKWQQEGHRLRVAVSLPKVNEVVWLEVTSWRGGKGAGILLSQPQHVQGLNSGDTSSFTADMVMDYKLSNPEGEIEAGGVDELVRNSR